MRPGCHSAMESSVPVSSPDTFASNTEVTVSPELTHWEGLLHDLVNDILPSAWGSWWGTGS